MNFLRSIFSKIQDIERANKLIRDCCNAILFFSVIQVVGLLLLKQYANFVDVFAYLLISLFVRKYKSRTVSVIFFIMAIASFVMTMLNRLGLESSGGANIFLAILLVSVATQLLRAVFFWNHYYKVKMKTKKMILLSGLTILLFFIITFLGLVVLSFFGDQMTDEEIESLSGTLLFSAFLISIIIIYGGIIPYSRGESMLEKELSVN